MEVSDTCQEAFKGIKNILPLELSISQFAVNSEKLMVADDSESDVGSVI